MKSMLISVMAIVCAAFGVACTCPQSAGVGGSGGSGGSTSTDTTSESGTGGSGGGSPAVCATDKDCPAAPGDAVCQEFACDSTGKTTDKGVRPLGCHLEWVSKPCFVNGCTGYCQGEAPDYTPPLVCKFYPGSACADGGVK